MVSTKKLTGQYKKPKKGGKPWRIGAFAVQPLPAHSDPFPAYKEIHLFKILLLSLLVVAAYGYAELYQWTDGNNVKHFSHTPPVKETGAIRQMEEYAGEEKEDVDVLQQAIDLFKTDTVQIVTAQDQKKKSSPAVVLFTTPTCGYCHRAKAYFNQHGIRFTEYDVSRSKKARQAFEALNGRGVPLIVIGDQRIAGFNKSAINRALGLP
jgi:glutaredoxin